jgi:MFS family permease
MQNPFAAIRAPAARDLWLAGVGVNIVRWLEILAFALLALQLTGSPFWVAAMTTARMLPLLAGAFMTAFVAGWAKRSVLVAVFGLLILIGAVLCLITATGSLELWHLLAASLLAGFAWTLETPIRRTALAEAAGLERVQGSMGLEVVSNQTTRILGPALGGVLLDTTGVIGVFALGTVVHGLCLWLCWRQTEPEDTNQPARRAAIGLRDSIAEAIAYVRRHRLLMGTIWLTFVFNFWAFPYISLAPVILETVQTLTPTFIGLVMAAEATGALIAAFLVIANAHPAIFARIYSLGALLFLCGTLTFGFTTTALAATLALFVAGFGMAGFNAMQISLPIAACPPAIRVRVMGLVTVAIGAAPFGFLHAGLMAEWLGAAMAQKVIATEGLLALALFFWLWPELLRKEAPKPL